MAQRTLRQLYTDAMTARAAVIESPKRHDDPQHQQQLLTTIKILTELKTAINNRAIFSTNESIEDVNTTEIKYLCLDYYVAQLYAEYLSPSKTQCLKKAIISYLQYLTSLKNYGLLDKSQREKYDALRKDPFALQALYSTAELRRDEKIANYKLEKLLNTKLEELQQLEKYDNEYQNADEEHIRELYISQLQLLAMKAFELMRLLAQELEMLANMPEPKITEVIEDDRQQNKSDPTQFTDKLEFLNKDVLSKEGKILRPFTLMTRADLKKKVVGTGQYLPTMTVEELIEQELANGGMISGGGNDGPQDSDGEEDDMDKADLETYKQRSWDEYAESHAKGSGNTMNRG